MITDTPIAAKHPHHIYTLFFTEMWERMSYYGMRALLVLFMVDQLRGGIVGVTGVVLWLCAWRTQRLIWSPRA